MRINVTRQFIAWLMSSCGIYRHMTNHLIDISVSVRRRPFCEEKQPAMPAVQNALLWEFLRNPEEPWEFLENLWENKFVAIFLRRTIQCVEYKGDLSRNEWIFDIGRCWLRPAILLDFVLFRTLRRVQCFFFFSLAFTNSLRDATKNMSRFPLSFRINRQNTPPDNASVPAACETWLVLG